MTTGCVQYSHYKTKCRAICRAHWRHINRYFLVTVTPGVDIRDADISKGMIYANVALIPTPFKLKSIESICHLILVAAHIYPTDIWQSLVEIEQTANDDH